MRAFLLAAGKGERLKPLTNETPKPLINIAGKSLILHRLEALKRAGVRDVVINISYMEEKFHAEYANWSNLDMNIEFSYEKNILGTGGGIGKVIDFFKDDEFIVCSSDIWTDYNLNQLLINKPFSGHLVLVNNSKLNPEGDVSLLDNIVSLKNEENSYSFSGIALLNPDLFKAIRKENYDLWKEVLKPAVLNEIISGEIFEGNHININTFDDLQKIDGYTLGE